MPSTVLACLSLKAAHSCIAYNLHFDLIQNPMSEVPIPGLYERLVTEDLKRFLNSLESDQVTLESPDTADAYISIAEHLRKLIEQALRSMPEDDRLTRQAELCNSVITWLQ